MKSSARRTADLFCAWSGAPFVLMFFVGLLIFARWVPPPSPADSAQQVADLYIGNLLSIRAGMLICYVGTVFFFTFGAGIVRQTRRIVDASRALIYMQIGGFTGSAMIFVFSVIFWWVASYRPDTRPPDDTQLLNDLAWITFVVGFVPYIAWTLSIGWAILCDWEGTIYPRWTGYFSVYIAIAFNTSALLVFFKTGPFAWNGIFAFWVPLFNFFTWMVVMVVYTVRAVDRASAIEVVRQEPAD